MSDIIDNKILDTDNDTINEDKKDKIKYSLLLADDGTDCGLVLSKDMILSIFLPFNMKEYVQKDMVVPENAQFIDTIYRVLSNEETKQELVNTIIELAQRIPPKE